MSQLVPKDIESFDYFVTGFQCVFVSYSALPSASLHEALQVAEQYPKLAAQALVL